MDNNQRRSDFNSRTLKLRTENLSIMKKLIALLLCLVAGMCIMPNYSNVIGAEIETKALPDEDRFFVLTEKDKNGNVIVKIYEYYKLVSDVRVAIYGVTGMKIFDDIIYQPSYINIGNVRGTYVVMLYGRNEMSQLYDTYITSLKFLC